MREDLQDRDASRVRGAVGSGGAEGPHGHSEPVPISGVSELTDFWGVRSTRNSLPVTPIMLQGQMLGNGPWSYLGQQSPGPACCLCPHFMDGMTEAQVAGDELMGVWGQQQVGRWLCRAPIFSVPCRWGPLRTASAWGLGGAQIAAPRLMTRKPGPARSHPMSEVTQPCEGRGV